MLRAITSPVTCTDHPSVGLKVSKNTWVAWTASTVAMVVMSLKLLGVRFPRSVLPANGPVGTSICALIVVLHNAGRKAHSLIGVV